VSESSLHNDVRNNDLTDSSRRDSELAEVLFRESDLDGAMEATSRALASAPDTASPMITRGHALLAAGRPEEAHEIYERAVRCVGENDENKLSTHVHRARLTAFLGDLVRTPNAPSGLLVKGPYLDTSGYASMVRRFVREWRADGIPVFMACKMWGPPTQLGPEFPTLDELSGPVAAKAAVHFELPDSVLPISGTANINFSMTEYTRVPKSWVRRAAWHDRLIVPTRSSFDAWTASGLSPDRILLCPLGCDPPDGYDSVSPFSTTTPSGRPLSGYKVRVLSLTSGIVRKNLGGMLRAWARATRSGDDAVLIIKLGKGTNLELLNQYFSFLLTENKIQRGDMADVVLITDNMSDQDILGLFKASTHYWSMSFGEGWDLPMAQAGACGLELIAPAHSSYLAYLTPETAHLLPATVTDAQAAWPDTPARWWRPDEEAAAAVVRGVIDGAIPSKASARDHLLTHFRWRDAARRLAEICADAELERKRGMKTGVR